MALMTCWLSLLKVLNEAQGLIGRLHQGVRPVMMGPDSTFYPHAIKPDFAQWRRG